MQEYSRILIEEYCMTHNSAKSRRLQKLVKILVQLFHKLRRDLLREGEGREVSKAVGDVAEEHGAAL